MGNGVAWDVSCRIVAGRMTRSEDPWDDNEVRVAIGSMGGHHSGELIVRNDMESRRDRDLVECAEGPENAEDGIALHQVFRGGSSHDIGCSLCELDETKSFD